MRTDNGCMNEEELKNAKKYGSGSAQSSKPRKIGLGMKTASTAFARKLVVVSEEKVLRII